MTEQRLSRLEQEINSQWDSFSPNYKKMGEQKQYALDMIKDAIVGEIEPRTTVNRVDCLVEAVDSVATELYGQVRNYSAKLIDAYTAHVSRTNFKSKHPKKYNILLRLSNSLDARHVKSLRHMISELKKENRQLNKENLRIQKMSDRSARLCNSAYTFYFTDSNKALELYQKALAIEPSDERKDAIHTNIGGLYFNKDQFSEALEEFKQCRKTKEIRNYIKECKFFIKNPIVLDPLAETPVAAPPADNAPQVPPAELPEAPSAPAPAQPERPARQPRRRRQRHAEAAPEIATTPAVEPAPASQTSPAQEPASVTSPAEHAEGGLNIPDLEPV
jgi:tetratricopeptide (TPR) repeat protein